MDPLTAKILTYDMGHLSQQEIEHLHALKNLVQKQIIRDYYAKIKDLG